jgi:hypothetical protein
MKKNASKKAITTKKVELVSRLLNVSFNFVF